MNSDSPTLPATHLTEAFGSLEAGADVVLGPCDDGGYSLIGVKQPIPRLLHEVQMSTPTVAVDTIALAVEENLKVHLLQPWYDVDDAASLIQLAADVMNGSPHAARHTRRYIRQHAAENWLK